MFKRAAAAYKPPTKSVHGSATTPDPMIGSNGPKADDLDRALRPAPPATVNQKNAHMNAPVKRTSSGLAKAIGTDTADAFGAGRRTMGSQGNPFILDDIKKSGVILDVDDFDSDIDLDVEDLAPKSTVSYPKLPVTKPQFQAPTISKVYSSALHTQAAVAVSRDEPPFGTPNHQSSGNQPLPWSSSPAHHLQPLAKSHDHSTQQEPACDAVSRPAKRRTLPWLLDNEDVEVSRPVPTLQTKELNSSPYPWNTTASAVKEQQKQLRKANKKPSDNAIEEMAVTALTSKKAKAVVRPHLSAEQRHVLDLVVDNGKSVFFTGSAGTGKSVLLREIIAVLRKKHKKELDRVAVTASTGLAACNIGGVTLHSFSGIGLGKEEVPELVKKIKRNQKAKHRWLRTKVLVVDEVSMVDGDLFDKLEEIARTLRSNGRPFGGIQLVITGDFFQLPPVPDKGSGRMSKFSFDAKTWNSAINHTIGLHHVFRQKDPVFAGMLNEMREGLLSPASISAFKGLSRNLEFDDEVTATELFPTRGEVDAANTSKMRSLAGEVYSFEARDGGAITDQNFRRKLLENCMASELLNLKKGSQVMLIKNMDDSLVNGSLGKVIAFQTEDQFAVRARDEDEDAGNAGFGGDFGYTSPTKAKFKKEMLGASTTQRWPLVRFHIADGTTRDLLCLRETWKVELPNGEIQASRSQVPLILAWALSIHKAQGQTLERVKVDLGKVFEKGQAYVALSRATSMAGLQVLRFDPAKVVAHERVRNFYAGLSRAEANGNL